jgi:hypothetical protein
MFFNIYLCIIRYYHPLVSTKFEIPNRGGHNMVCEYYVKLMHFKTQLYRDYSSGKFAILFRNKLRS